MATQNWLPGAGSLGCCIDIFGEYDAGNAGRPLFDLKAASQPWAWPPGASTSYTLPSNVYIPQILAAGTGDFKSFKSMEDFANSLAVSAKINGSYGGFEGEASAQYKATTNVSVTTTLSTFTMDYQSYRITLQTPSASDLSQSVLNDPDYKSLPTTFDPANDTNVELFAQFFSKFGTHFIDSIICGGQLKLYTWSENTKIATQTDIEANVTASYKGLFSAGAQASVAWSQTSKSAFDDLHVRIEVKGGDPSVLKIASASYGDNYNAEYQSWCNSIATTPVPRDFTVAEISMLFSGTQRQAVHSACVYFMSKWLTVYADPTHMQTTVTVQGSNKIWSAISGGPFKEAWNWTLGGMFVVVVDRKTLDKKFAATWDVSKGRVNQSALPSQSGDTWASAIYDPIVNNDLAPYVNDPEVIIILVLPYCSSLWSYPSTAFSAFLGGLGGGNARIKQLASHQTSATETLFSYVMVGVPHRADLSSDSIQFGNGQSLVINNKVFLRPHFGSQSTEYEPFEGW